MCELDRIEKITYVKYFSLLMVRNSWDKNSA